MGIRRFGFSLNFLLYQLSDLGKSIKFSMCRVLIWMETSLMKFLIYNLGMQFVQWILIGAQCTFSWIKRIFWWTFFISWYIESFFFLFYVFLSSHISLLMLYLLNNLSVLLGEMQSWPCKNKAYLQEWACRVWETHIWICIQAETQTRTRLELV